jgi:hypothetical protein
MSIVIPDISPAELLAGFRGRIFHSKPGYPERINLKSIDSKGAEWRFSTHDAYYAPSDPEALLDKTVVSVDHEGPLGNLTIGFSDGTSFRVWVEPQEAPDDPINWRLRAPEGLVLAWGPGVHWAWKRGSDPF